MWFMVSIAIMAVGGFVAWAVAARVQPVDVVGSATALFASLLFITYLTGMGLPVAVARFGHEPPPTAERLWSWAVLYAAVASTVGAIGFMAVAPRLLGPEVTEPLNDIGALRASALLGVLVIGMTWAALAEMRLMTLRMWPLLVLRAALTVTIRIPLIFTPIAETPLGLLVVIGGPAAISGLVGVGLLSLRREARRWFRLTPLPPNVGAAWTYATVNWMGTLASQAPQFVAPLIVAATVSASDNAEFYLAWSITTVVFLVAHAVGQVVISEAARSAGQLRAHVRRGLVIGLGVGGVATSGAWLGQPIITAVFGDDYSATAAVLPLLCVAALPWAVTSMCLAVVRVKGDWLGTMVITVMFAALTLLPIAILVPSRGSSGAAVGWAVGNVAAAGVAVAYTAITQALANRRRQPGDPSTLDTVVASDRPVTTTPLS
jgi:O-antigen/teichoic acid export membrane protein